MQLEVERKYRLTDPAGLKERLRGLGALLAETELQEDCYYAHPVRDFAATDEALRLRRIGETNFITYKGPKLDPHSKTRQEIELPLAPGAESLKQFGRLLETLGFRPVATVRKHRGKAKLDWEGREIEIACDDVEDVGAYVELETTAVEAARQQAEGALKSLAETLGLGESERRSYLELLLLGRQAHA